MSGHRLLIEALAAGASDLKRHASLLDDINVFPVADADTGRNMSAAVNVLVDMKESLIAAPIEALPALLEEPLLLGACGNSGIILAQFLVGFFESLARAGSAGFEAFLDGVSAGRDKAYRAVSAPREGTMLTAMTRLRDLLLEARGAVSLDEHATLERALAFSVKDTRAQMETLERAGVVDSGALGFHLLAGGLTLALPAEADPLGATAIAERARGDTSALFDDILEGIDRPSLGAAKRTGGYDRRYCVNLLVEARVKLEAWSGIPPHIGSSVNAAVAGKWIRLHVHADDPDAVRASAEALGDVRETSIQDMWEGLVHRGAAPSISTSVSVRIGADSAVSLGSRLAAELGIARIEHAINVGDRAIPDSRIGLAELMHLMKEGHQFTTAQISPYDAKKFFDETLQSSAHLVLIAVGRAYTGTQDTLARVLEDYPERERITLLDSRAASGQQGIACIAAAELAARTHDVKAVVEHAEHQIATAREYLVIDDLTYLRRSGRIGKIKAAFASFLSVKPIVGHGGDGAITHAKVKNHEAAVEEITRRALRHPGEGALLAMVEYTDNMDFAKHLQQDLRKRLRGATVMLAPLSASSAVHMGPGTWGVAVTRTA